jgi:hypothetical protein
MALGKIIERELSGSSDDRDFGLSDFDLVVGFSLPFKIHSFNRESSPSDCPTCRTERNAR